MEIKQVGCNSDLSAEDASNFVKNEEVLSAKQDIIPGYESNVCLKGTDTQNNEVTHDNLKIIQYPKPCSFIKG